MALLEASLRALSRGRALLRPQPPVEAPGEGLGRTGPRIAVIGNCQARGVARALGVLLPQARVSLLPMGRLGREERTLTAFAKRLEGFDHVFSQPFAPGFFPDGGAEALRGLLPRTRLFPAIVFPAFHPDLVYVGEPGATGHAQLVPSPLHTYHSAIALFGHLRGLTPERVAGLFREETFAELGYLEMWGLSAEDLLASGRAIGFDLADAFLRWGRRGAFMHAINHPKLFVTADIATRLAREAGLAPADLAVEAYIADDLLDDAVWPIYPGVAAIYGLSGGYLFKRRGQPGAAPALLGLDAFLRESFSVYRKTPRPRLRSHRTDHWDGLPAIRALFDAA